MKFFGGFVFFCGLLFVVGQATPGSAAQGGELFSRCARCHGDTGDKPPHILKGQGAEAILGKLQGYSAGTYGGDKKNVMANMVKGLSDDDKRELARHISEF